MGVPDISQEVEFNERPAGNAGEAEQVSSKEFDELVGTPVVAT